MKQTIRKDLTEEGNGESRGGLREGRVDDGTTRIIVHAERKYQMLMKQFCHGKT